MFGQGLRSTLQDSHRKTDTPCTRMIQPHTLFFKAATGKALTTVRAGFALTSCITPKISFLHALVAGLKRVLIIATPGMVNLPLDFTSLATISARLSMILDTSDVLSSASVAMALAISVFVMGLPPAFFITAFILGAIS